MAAPPDGEKFKYKPLERKHAIRIVHLEAGEANDSISVEISTETLENKHFKYSALSWEWGNLEPHQDYWIRIRHKRTGNNHNGNNNDTQVNANNDHTNNTNSYYSSTRWSYMPVKPNLWHALKRLRRSDEIVRLWIDAICIDQNDQDDDLQAAQRKKTEKSKQIAMMTKIFESAEDVKVWLGEAGEDDKDEVAKAVHYIDRIVNLDDTNHIAGVESSIFDRASSNDLEPLVKLLRRGWFSRRWVVQEIAVAREATLHCGGEYVSWKKLAHAVALLEKVGRDGTINRMLRTRPATHHVSEYVGNISSLPAYRLVQNTFGLFRERNNDKIWQYTLEELVSFLAVFQASRSQDIIYAILGIASDFNPVHIGHHENDKAEDEHRERPLIGRHNTLHWGVTTEPFEVDYDQTPLHVFKRFLDKAMKKSQSLDILCRPWAPVTEVSTDGKVVSIEQTLPSWIPSLSRKPFQVTKEGKMVRFNPDPLVGPAVFRHKFFNASGTQKPNFKIDWTDDNSKLITVEGFELATIDEMWDSGVFGNVPASWLRAGNWNDENELPPDELWRTLVADRDVTGGNVDPWYPVVFKSVVRDRGIRYGFDTNRLIHDKDNAAISEVFRRVQAVVWDRKLIRTTDLGLDWLRPGRSKKNPGHLGLAPSDAREGDKVCIIFGCSVPLVLRKVEPRSENGDSQPGPEQDRKQQRQNSSIRDSSPGNHTAAANEAPPLDAKSDKSGDGVIGPFPTSPKQAAALTAPQLPAKEVHHELPGGNEEDEFEDEKHMTELYTLVGECYIDNMMDGQAMTEHKLKECRKFRIE